MAGDSYCTLIVAACPEEQRRAALEVIAEKDLRTEYDGLGDELQFATPYVADDCEVMLTDSVGSALVAAAPGITFSCSTDPCDDGLGLVFLHAPDLGVYQAECDSDGAAMLRPHAIAALIAAWPEVTTRDEAAAAFDRACGGPWMRQFEAAL